MIIEEIFDYYKKQGAPTDQEALKSMLREIQQEQGGFLTTDNLMAAAEYFGVKSSFLLAIVNRFPSLHLQDCHCLELCGGPNCSRRKNLMAYVEKKYGTKPQGFTVNYASCMRLCGKGPNIKWDGRIYHHADEKLIDALVAE